MKKLFKTSINFYLIVVTLFTFGCDNFFEPDDLPSEDRATYPLPQPSEVDFMPDWSPDGKKIAYTHVALDTSELVNGYYQIWIMNIETGEKEYLTPGMSPKWHPYGEKLAFKAGGLYTIKIDGSKLTYIEKAHEGRQLPDWHPNGKILAYEHSSPDAWVGTWVHDIQSGIDKYLNIGGTPRWSPEGQRLLFVGRDLINDSYIQIWLIDVTILDEYPFVLLHDSTKAQVTFQSRQSWYPSWHPNGNEIIFSSWDGDMKYWQIHKINISNNDTKQLTVHGGSYPCYSPDGAKIVYSGLNRNSESLTDDTINLWIMDSDGSNQRQLTFGQFVDP